MDKSLFDGLAISKESIFSDLNNPKIHSISDERFDEWFGFTDEETVRMLNELGRAVRKNLVQDLTYRDMTDQPGNIWSILYTTGYLTHRTRYEDGLKEFFAAFTSGDAETLEDCLNYHLGESVSYLDGGNYEDKETFYHGLLLGMFRTRKGWEIKSEREAGNGRTDITVFNLRKKDAYIIEVKYSKSDKDLNADAQEAVDQIRRLRYDQFFSQRAPESIRHYGIAFCLKQCRVLTE
ncbi:MAG: ATP-binding protein [Clostridiales bacterium]|nr:ATP-binding protein [Clostridiales bacterium]